ncbi:30S ribosomal protein S12 methylthiotransferase RimO [Thiorhodospira sibirica]|uniref:30S ribosomal protein S12 methylthiotransferase RimO n=1 Tax=Thiorhodospira sibirica TaxID=154347 RepID=UPI00022C52C0|nr:30S ribosomal protein S12 methylthiotransferase RimO [Thiorhodospira sibirica]
MSSTATTPQIGFVSLGCPKALVDSERILTALRARGYDICGSYAQADLVIINTCGFIEAAVDESLEVIGEALAENGRVIVTGCLGAKAEQIRSAYPELLAVTGPEAVDEVLAAVMQHLPLPEIPFATLVPPQGIKLTPRHYAYLKISEGCSHRCRFCIIPQLRGDLVSRPIGEILQEAQHLVEGGAKELLVIAQDTSAYGMDVGYRTGFWGGRPLRSDIQTLARTLGELGVWVRLHYVYPHPQVDDLVALMAEGLILPYLDMPLQHASPAVLKAMRRPGNIDKMRERIAHWRTLCPELTLRSTFIVGFPGEAEADFAALLDFLEEVQFDRVGCFTYSAVDGAAANQLLNAVAEDIKAARQAELMSVQADISASKLAQRIGQSLQVLVDGHDAKGGYLARSRADAPEVDGVVYVDSHIPLNPGDLITVEVTESDEHDLYAVLAD